jgi:tRNA threonylcarbamoyl adenosine modification protein (Sua5/YciO/YrdC/YwlC family)
MSSVPTSSADDIFPPTTSTTNNNKTDAKSMVAKRVSASRTSIDQCGERLRSGMLVSFPTETVYGLGCNALDPVAVQSIFDAKERPLSDPLIVHVSRSEDALEMWDAFSSLVSDEANQDQPSPQYIERQALSVLTKSFFPGPLTIVARAHPSIPQVLMANTGYVACRSPSHPIARALIASAKVPIAAPSANKFGHVSPTLADHVMDDLGMEDVWVVDPSLGRIDIDENANDANHKHGDNAQDNTAVCQVGVESTVAKVEMNPSSVSGVMGRITVLRHGAISSQSIQEVVEKSGLSRYFLVSDSVQFTSEKVYNVAPGQTVKHYSPNVPCFMIGSSRQIQFEDGNEIIDEKERAILAQSVIIDYGMRLASYRKFALAYNDLSVEGNPVVAASNVFKTLRWSETIDGAVRVFVPEIVLRDDENHVVENSQEMALVLAVKDKLTRAASAVVVETFE